MNRFFRKWHRWISVLTLIPFSITLVTGIILSTRAFNSWVQPSHPEMRSHLSISFDQLLGAAKSVPEAEIHDWKDVSQIDIRPGSGNIRVRSKKTNWEVQVDGATGQVTGSGIRRFSWLVSLHEGAYFGPAVRYGVFLPSALGILFLLVSGFMIFIQPYLLRKNRTQRELKDVIQ